MSATPRRRPWQRIDVRVAAWAGLVAVAILVAGAFAFRAAVHARQMDATVELARTEAAEIIGLTIEDVQVTGSFGPLPFELLRSDGTVIAATDDLTALQAQGWTAPIPSVDADPLVDVVTSTLTPPAGASSNWRGGMVTTVASTIQSDQILVRGVNSFLVNGHGTYRVYVFATPQDADAAVASMDPYLWSGVALAVVLVAATAAFTVRLALRPVETMRRQAASITSAEDGSRLPPTRRHDELSLLATTLDTMLGRLHDSFRAQQRFTGDAAHELRGPLASLRTAVEVSLAHPGAIAADKTLHHVLAETDRLQDLTEQLLTVARAQSGPVTPGATGVDPATALDRLFATYPASDAPPIRVADHRGAPACATISPDDLHRVLRNLVDNARRHAATSVRVDLWDDDDRIALDVSNDGPPIAIDERERIFEPFVRLDDARTRDKGGTGLGLAIVRGLVKHAGGSVGVTSSETETTFTVWLPRCPAPHATMAAASPPREPPAATP